MSLAYETKIAEAIHLFEELVGAKALKVTLAFSHQSEDAINIALAQKAGGHHEAHTLLGRQLKTQPRTGVWLFSQARSGVSSTCCR